MKFLPTPTTARQHLRGDDSLGRGMEIVLTMALFLGLGWLIDRWLGTTPIFMIGMFLLAGVAMFASMKYRYDATMAELEAKRAADAVAHRSAPKQDAA